jgi:hypothetical protein
MASNGERVEFNIPKTIFMDVFTTLPRSREGYPQAAYNVPMGAWIDKSGRYQAIGGQIYAKCKMERVRTSAGKMGARGNMIGWHYTGGVYAAPSMSSASPGGRGWSFKDFKINVESGVGDGWRAALATFLNGGGCTRGWEIWVDGKQTCAADGTALV